MMTATNRPALRVWADVSKHDLDRIISSATPSQLRLCVEAVMQLPDSMQGQILCDMYISAIKFAKLNHFTPIQISTLMSILKQVHTVCTSTPFGNFEATFLYFKELMLLHSVNRPPWSLRVFDTRELAMVTQYIQDTYFRHFKMYKYAFTPKVKLDLSLSYAGRAASPVPEGLNENIDPDSESVAVENEESELTTTDVPAAIEESATEADEASPANKETDNAVLNELESIIKKAISSQIKQLSSNVEQQLIETDKAITEKIQSASGGRASAKGRKSPKGSAKGKRK